MIIYLFIHVFIPQDSASGTHLNNLAHNSPAVINGWLLLKHDSKFSQHIFLSKSYLEGRRRIKVLFNNNSFLRGRRETQTWLIRFASLHCVWRWAMRIFVCDVWRARLGNHREKIVATRETWLFNQTVHAQLRSFVFVVWILEMKDT